MDSYDSESRRILQRFSNCTRFSRDQLNLRNFANLRTNFQNFVKISQIFTKFCKFSFNIAFFRCKFHRFFSEFHGMLGNCSKSLNFEDFSEISQNLGRKNVQRPEKPRKIFVKISIQNSAVFHSRQQVPRRTAVAVAACTTRLAQKEAALLEQAVEPSS